MTTLSVLSSPSGNGESAAARSPYSLIVSSDAAHRTAAQRLRYDVFAAEPGFDIPDNGTGLDADLFDEHCDHLLIRDNATERFIGCYRMLLPAAAAKVGYYTATEFDIGRLDPLGSHIVEMGRACVDPGHRNGAVLGLMWAGVLHYLELTGHRWAMGCVSVPMRGIAAGANGIGGEQDGVNVRGVRDMLLAKHATDPQRRVRPHRPVVVDGRTLDEIPPPARPKLPPLLSGYLRLGASICGEPAHDPDFAVADFVALLGLEHMNRRYLERLQAAAANFVGGART